MTRDSEHRNLATIMFTDIRCDVDGNVWAAAAGGGEGNDGVHIFAPDGKRIGQIRLPEACANLCFGGAKRNRLFMTARHESSVAARA